MFPTQRKCWRPTVLQLALSPLQGSRHISTSTSYARKPAEEAAASVAPSSTESPHLPSLLSVHTGKRRTADHLEDGSEHSPESATAASRQGSPPRGKRPSEPIAIRSGQCSVQEGTNHS